MQLYRLMTEVRAGAKQPKCRPGQAGIATIWVRADSEESACARGKEILAGREYASHGDLTSYLEETPADVAYATVEAASEAGQREGEVLTGYSEIKAGALRRGDGLFEAWFPT